MILIDLKRVFATVALDEINLTLSSLSEKVRDGVGLLTLGYGVVSFELRLFPSFFASCILE